MIRYDNTQPMLSLDSIGNLPQQFVIVGSTGVELTLPVS